METIEQQKLIDRMKSWIKKGRIKLVYSLGGVMPAPVAVQYVGGSIMFTDIYAFVKSCFVTEKDASEVVFCSQESELCKSEAFERLLRLKVGDGKVTLVVVVVCEDQIGKLYCIVGDVFDAQLSEILLQHDYMVRIKK